MNLQPLDIVDDRSAFQRWLDGDGPKAKPSYVYVASSWRNPLQQGIVAALRSVGLQVYDFRAPVPGNDGFRWSKIDPQWLGWTPRDWQQALSHPIAKRGFHHDKAALGRADCGVLVLPCGRSAHLEAGYLAGFGKPVFTVAFDHVEPELMALLLGPPRNICTTMNELFDRLGVE
jgi:hypothetical protein